MESNMILQTKKATIQQDYKETCGKSRVLIKRNSSDDDKTNQDENDEGNGKPEVNSKRVI